MTLRVPVVLRRNVRLKVMAAGIALVVWSVVVYANNPPDSRTFSVPVQFSTGGTRWVLDVPLDPLALRVTGTRAHVDAFDPSRVVARVDVSRISRDGVQDVPILLTNTDPDIEIEAPPSTVRAFVDLSTTLQVPISPKYVKTPPAGFIPRPPTITPGSVLVSGPKRVIEQVSARVDIDLESYKTNFQQSLPIRLIDPVGAVVTTLSTSPSLAVVDIIIDSAVTSRAVPVIVVPQGLPAGGHLLGSLTADPQTVVLNGPQTVLNRINDVTVPVNVAGLYGSVTVSGISVAITVAGVTATPDHVDVRVNILSAPPSPTPPPVVTPTPTPLPTPPPPGVPALTPTPKPTP